MANTENVPIDSLSSKEETTNYCRIIFLMVDVGTETLLHLFYSLVPKHTVKGYFSSKKIEIEDGERKKFFDKSQYAKLTCADPNPDEFDISLLIKLIKYFKLSQVKLDNLQKIRNKIVAHKCRAELINQDFESLWVRVENILLNIARCVSRDEEQLTKVKITELKEKVLDVSDREKKIIKIFEAWYKEEISALHEKSDHNLEEISVLHEKSDHNQKEVAVLLEKSGHNQEEIAVLHEKSDQHQGQIAVLHEKLDHNLEEIAVLHEKSGQNQKEIAVLHEKSDQHQGQIAVLHEKSDHNQEEIAVLHEKSGHNQEQIAVLHENMQSLQHKVKGNPHAENKSFCVTEDKIVIMLQQDLIAYYIKWFSRFTLSPLIDEHEYAVDFLKIYVKPILAIPRHQGPEGQSRSIPVESCHDIFVKNSKPCQCIYISSPAGCGKTSLARWLALTWCQAHQPVVSDNKWFTAEDLNEMRTFMFLFIVFLRDEHEQECDVDIMIQNQLLPKLANSTTYTELGLKFLQNLFSSVKCIIILDGLDEWSHPPGNKCMLKNKRIPHNRARPLCTTLTTSRPWKLDVVGLKPEEIDQKLELNGLNDDLLKRLIDNVVTEMYIVHGKKIDAYDFQLKLQCKLPALSKIPVVVIQLLTLWFDNESLGESQCDIYSNMVEFLLKRYCKMKEIASVIEDIEVDDCSRDRQIPKCLQNKLYCKAHMELLSKLATLAYNTLFTNNEESLVFDKKITRKYLTDQEIEMSLAVGILTQEKVIGKLSIRQSHSSFIHKTFQEYLAALYVALNPGKETEKIKNVCCSIEKILEMSKLFMFLNGLCPEVMVNLHEHLRQTVLEDSVTQKYRASSELDPWSSEGKTLNQVQDTMVECLVECRLNKHMQVQDTMVDCLVECRLNKDKHVTHLAVSDFFIWSSSKWSNELKSLAVNNPVYSLCVGYYYRSDIIEDILNSVTVFNSIQKLWLWQVPETFLEQLVLKHKHSLGAKPMTWRNLECVSLAGVENMSIDILNALVDSILQLPNSVQVGFWGYSKMKKCIKSHSRLKVDVNDHKFLQFHTIKPEHVLQ